MTMYLKQKLLNRLISSARKKLVILIIVKLDRKGGED